MDFWDRVVFRCCLGLGEGHFVGFHRARALMDLAITTHGLFPTPPLSPLSRILLLLVSGPGDAVFQTLCPPGTHHGFTPLQLWGNVREALRPRLADLHALAFQRGQPQRAMMQGIFHLLLVPDLTTFLTRLTLCDEAPARLLAASAFTAVFPSIDPSPYPTADQDARIRSQVEVALYQAFLHNPILWTHVPTWPAVEPPWLAALPSNAPERRMLIASQQVNAQRRCLLLLSLYGQLSLRTITLLVRSTIDRKGTPDAILRDLHAAWQRVFSLM